MQLRTLSAVLLTTSFASQPLSNLTTPSRNFILPENKSGEAIQKALRDAPANSTVFLPPATYIANSPIVIDRNDVTLEGSGSGTIIKLADNINQPLLVVGSAQTTKEFQTPFIVNNITVSNLVLDGNMLNQQQEVFGGNIEGAIEIRNNCLTIRGAVDVKIANVETKHARSGGVVLEKGCKRIKIDGLNSHHNFFDGFAGYETTESDFNNMLLSHNNAAGISIDIRFNSNIIRNSVMHSNGSQGVFMRDSSDNQFVNNKITNSKLHGVFIARAEHPNTDAIGNTFSGVEIFNSGAEGFRVNDLTCTHNTISGAFGNNAKGNISFPEGMNSPQVALTKLEIAN